MSRKIKISNTEPDFFKYSYSFLKVYLPTQAGRSDNTVDSYAKTLNMFRKYLNYLGLDYLTFPFCACTPEFVRGFLSWLDSEHGNCESTRNHRLVDLKGYLDYAAEQDVSLVPILSAVRKIKPFPVPRPEKFVLSSEQVAAILSQAPQTEKGCRNRVLLLLLYESAMRVSELASLTLENLYLDRERPFISVYGKGKKERHVILSKEMGSILRKYVSEHHGGRSKYLFYTKSKGEYGPMTSRNIELILQDYATKARAEKDPSIPEHVYPHSFRRAKATTLYRGGMPLELVSSFLGHSQLETTRNYAIPSPEQMRKAAEKSMPEEAYTQKPKWKGSEEEIMRKLGLK